MLAGYSNKILHYNEPVLTKIEDLLMLPKWSFMDDSKITPIFPCSSRGISSSGRIFLGVPQATKLIFVRMKLTD